jgi:hypothetical protein
MNTRRDNEFYFNGANHEDVTENLLNKTRKQQENNNNGKAISINISYCHILIFLLGLSFLIAICIGFRFTNINPICISERLVSLNLTRPILTSHPKQEHLPYWHNLSANEPSLCVNAQRKVRAYLNDECIHDSRFNSFDSTGYYDYAKRLLEIDCVFHGTLASPTAQYRVINPISSTARYYVSFVQAKNAKEDQEGYERRMMLSAFTLNRIKQIYGDLVEITLVEMRDQVEERYFQSSVNTIIDQTFIEGTDYGMHQLAIMYANARWKQFDWIFLINDQMVLVTHDFDQYLTETLKRGGNYFADSVWSECCLRGFLLVFHKELIATAMWNNYWNRIHFACEKISAMRLGEGIDKVTGWKNCQTATNTPIGKGMALQRMQELNVPFVYREGIENEFKSKSKQEMVEWVKTNKVGKFHIETCQLASQ